MLVTRPEPGATETAARLEALGFDPVLAPAFRIRLMQAELPDPTRVVAVLVTSGQAVPAIPDNFRTAKLFAVGDTTATRARQGGFIDVASAGGDANDLLAAVYARVPPPGPLLLVTGKGLGYAFASSLRAAGFAVIRRTVYARVPMNRLPNPALYALRSGSLRAALFFSADTATRFTTIVTQTALDDNVLTTDAVAISEATAVALGVLRWRRILVAARPNQDAMLALLR